MHGPFQRATVALACLLAMGPAGCTLFPAKNPPTLASTTSAEQHDRILWQLAQKRQWEKVAPLFSTTLVWQSDGKTLPPDQVAPYLKSLDLKDVQIRDATVQPNGADMTVAYSLAIASNGGQSREYSALSVWQQLKGGGYVLIAHSQQPKPGSATTNSPR
jgi:hypothetical protein